MNWNPEATYVLVTSIVAWEDKTLTPVKVARHDQALIAQFETAGVPSRNVVFLKDEAATRDALRTELRALACRAGAGSTLIFYFQGHGLAKSRKLYLGCYDARERDPTTGFDVEEMFPVLDAEWKGERLLLLGDGCYTGGLARVVERFERKPGVRAACFTATSASTRSTDRWTFTQTFIRALAGDPAADMDGDGKISFADVDRFVHDEMKYREDQLTRAARTSSFETDFVFGPVVGSRARSGERSGEPQRFEVYRRGEWRAVQILERRGGRCRVHISGWGSNSAHWVTEDKLRPLSRQRLGVGDEIEVEWVKGEWLLATVMKVEEDHFYFVHYEGENGDDDDWVTANRTRKPLGRAPREPRGPRPGPGGRPKSATGPGTFVTGDVVAARWRHCWFLATVTSARSGGYAVRYEDGETGSLTAGDLVPLALASDVRVGDRVLACWDEEPRMYPGVVRSTARASCTVAWEDGSGAADVPFGCVARIEASLVVSSGSR